MLMMKLATEIINKQRKIIESKKLDRIITSEYSTAAVAVVIDSIKDNYSGMLEKCVPEVKFNDLNEHINEYVESMSRAVFEQGFIRGVAVGRGGVI